MNLFFLSVLCVAREFFDAVDSIRQVSLIFQLWFQGLQWLCFRWRFLVGCDAVFTNDFMRQMTLFSLMISFVNRELVCAVNSIRQSWLNFQRWFLVLLLLIVCLTIPSVKLESIFAIGFMRRSWILLTLSTPYVSCHSYFSGDFKVYDDVVFADDFWSVGTQFSLTIPCVNDDSVFSNDFTRQPWISIRCWFYPSAVTQFSKMISRSTVTQFSLMIYGSALA